MSNKIVIVSVVGGVACVDYSEGVDTYVFDMDANELYLYNNTYICTIDNINDDGTVNLVCVDTSDGSNSNRSFYNVPVSKIDFYGKDEVGEYIEEGDDW